MESSFFPADVEPSQVHHSLPGAVIQLLAWAQVKTDPHLDDPLH